MADMAPSQDAASTGSRNTVLISIGYGLHMTWVSCLFYQGMLPAAVGNAPAYYQFFLASMSALVMSLVAFGFYASKSQRQDTFTRKSLSIVFAALMCVGTLACTEIGLDTFPKIILFIVSALATGIGSAWYNAAWGLQMTRLLSIDTVVALCGSYVLSAFLYYAASHLPAAGFLVIVALSPIGSAAALNIAATSAKEETGVVTSAETDDALIQDSKVFGLKILQAAFLFGIVLGSIQGIMNARSDVQQMNEHSSVLLVCLTIPLAAIVWYLKNSKRQSSPIERFVMVYRIALLTMVGALLIASVDGKPSAILHVVMLAGYTFFKIVVWTLLCQLGRSGGINPIRIVAWGEATLSLALLAGNLTLQTLIYSAEWPETIARIVIPICVALLLVGKMSDITKRLVDCLHKAKMS